MLPAMFLTELIVDGKAWCERMPGCASKKVPYTPYILCSHVKAHLLLASCLSSFSGNTPHCDNYLSYLSKDSFATVAVRPLTSDANNRRVLAAILIRIGTVERFYRSFNVSGKLLWPTALMQDLPFLYDS